MVNSQVFLKKTEALRSTKFIGSFQDLPNYPVMNEDAALKVSKAAMDKLEALIDQNPSLRSAESKTRWLRQGQIRLDTTTCLGSGKFSSVYQIKTIRSEDYKIYKADDLVVKLLRPELTTKPVSLASRLVGLAKEGYILAQLQHENILSIEAWPPTGISGISTGRVDSYFLVLPRLEQTLSYKLKAWSEVSKRLRFAIVNREKKKASLWQTRLDVLPPLADALRYLHKNNILHRDVKPANIGFTMEGVLKLYDFDMARMLPHTASPDETFELTACVGSMRYQSPECGLGEKYNCKSDVYAFALICHQVLSLEKPYAEVPSPNHYEFVFCQGVRPEIPSSWPEAMGSLIRAGWSRDLSARPTMETMHGELARLIPEISSQSDTQTKRSGLRRLSLRRTAQND